MAGIERDNPALKGVLPKDYARPALDKQRLGQLIDLISNIKVGDEASRAKDVLGRVYEYFLSQFASAEGKKGGEFYTPRCVVKLLVEMLEPYRGRVYDPCCGSSGMFVQSVEFIRAHASGNGNGGGGKGGKVAHPAKGGARPDISIYGQESNYTTWRLARMNLAIRGIDGQIGHGDTFHNDRHPDLKADFILANPPFNISDWGGERLAGDKRWQYGAPPAGQRQLRVGAAHRASRRALSPSAAMSSLSFHLSFSSSSTCFRSDSCRRLISSSGVGGDATLAPWPGLNMPDPEASDPRMRLARIHKGVFGRTRLQSARQRLSPASAGYSRVSPGSPTTSMCPSVSSNTPFLMSTRRNARATFRGTPGTSVRT
jgi:hypothetical protein